jgi:hypothetical protein
MITLQEEDYIQTHAYIPEHILGYGKAMSGGEPFLLDGYLAYLRKRELIFIGYPLNKTFQEKDLNQILEKARQQWTPQRIALIAPQMPGGMDSRESDAFYRLDLATLRPSAKVRNMIQRASREVVVEKGREMKREHRKLMTEFLRSISLDDSTRFLYDKIPGYLRSVSTSRLFSARNRRGRLQAFDIAEFGAAGYAFYLFNIRSRKNAVPGISDLLLHELILEAKEQKKAYLNLGLGIHPGVAFFKKKWGGYPFLQYESGFSGPAESQLPDSLVQKL